MTRLSSRPDTRKLTACALFAALMAVGAWISIPIGEISITMQLLPIMLASALLSPMYAALSVTVYVLLGAIGLPVFAGFRAGVGVLAGATGGYIVGFVVGALLTSLIITRWGLAWWKQALAMVLGVAVCYAIGTAWFMHLTGRGLVSCLSICVLPFIPFDLAKIAVSVVLSLRLRQPMKRILG